MERSVLGAVGQCRLTVTKEDTAAVMGSGDLSVFATPALVALMENAAVHALTGALPEGATTVGAAIELEHSAPTPVGMEVWAVATVTEQAGNSFVFSIDAFDEKGRIAKATHRRAAVFTGRFLQKVQEKLES